MNDGTRSGLLQSVAFASLLLPLLGACKSGGGSTGQGGATTGGNSAMGGKSSSGGSGGSSAAGGMISSGGSGSGGTTASGGSAGSAGSGGTQAGGGNGGSLGSSGSGGGSGGSSAGSGGATQLGGATGGGSGGAATGGATTVATGGAGGTGGARSGAGGTTGGTGGMGTGGSSISGGASGTGGAGVGGSTGTCPSIDFGTFTAGKAPADIGKLAVNNFKPHTGDAFTSAGYAWTFAYVASLQFTKLTADTTNNSYLISHFDCTQQGPSTAGGVAVDVRAFGDLPLEVFLENQNATCKTLGMTQADAQWAGTADTAVTPDARYWSDDMFMITGLQDFGYRATQDAKYLSRMALTMAAYLGKLQQSDGLFAHTTQTQAKWGRANGWFAAGMALLLQDLPVSNGNYAAIMAGYKQQMDGLLGVQVASGTDVGCWRQVLDRTDAWAESSCTAMFTYALVTGLKNGWLSGDKYVSAAKSGWTALGNKTDSSGVLAKVCPGTTQAAGSSGVGTDLKSQQDFYINISPGSNDQHGQAPLLWSAIALLRSDCPGMHR